MSDPFAPMPATPAQSGSPTVPCSACGAPIDPTQAGYSGKGELVCKRCEALDTIDAGEQRAIAGIVGSGFGALGIALAAIFFNPCLIVSAVAVMSGIAAIAMILRHPEYKPKMGARYSLAMGSAIAGIVIGVTAPFIGAFFVIVLALLTGR